MKRASLLIAGLAVALAAPASAETVIIKKKQGGHYGARAEMSGHRLGHGMRTHSHGHDRTVVIKRRSHNHRY